MTKINDDSISARDDFRKLLQLGPGALLRARWMSHLIYSLKINLFCLSFISPPLNSGLNSFNTFALKVVMKHGRPIHMACTTLCVPGINHLLAGHHLELSRTLDTYKIGDTTMAKSV